MTRFFIPLFLICFFSSLLSAQTDASSNVSARPERQTSPRETMLKNEAAELSNYSYHLAQLKEAFAANNAGKMAVEEYTPSFEDVFVELVRPEVNHA